MGVVDRVCWGEGYGGGAATGMDIEAGGDIRGEWGIFDDVSIGEVGSIGGGWDIEMGGSIGAGGRGRRGI